MRTSFSRPTVGIAAVCWWLVSAGCGSAAQAPVAAAKPARAAPAAGQAATPAEPVAVVDGQPLTRGALDAAVAPQIAKLDEQAYEIRRQQLDDMINQRLLESEAKRRGITVDALVAAEVGGKVPAVTEADVQKFINDNKERLPNPTAVLPQIRTYLVNERTTARRDAFLAELRTKAKVQVMLKSPSPYRAVIDLTGAPSRGPAHAPVTIVEFSDFHCPYCRRVQPTLQQLLAKYPTEVRLVYKHFPIDNLHPQARRAAEAAWCADQQQKFWQFHDVVYANPPDGSDAKLTEMATTAGLDVKAFDACLASGKAEAVIQAHIDEGTHYGVNGTPGFFVNGRLVSGALPLTAFAELIDEELAAAKATN